MCLYSAKKIAVLKNKLKPAVESFSRSAVGRAQIDVVKPTDIKEQLVVLDPLHLNGPFKDPAAPRPTQVQLQISMKPHGYCKMNKRVGNAFHGKRHEWSTGRADGEIVPG